LIGEKSKGILKMGSLSRSEDMQLLRLYISRTAAHDTMDELGKLGAIQLLDLNSETTAFQRTFAQDVKRCDEMLRRIRFFDSLINDTPELTVDESLLESVRDEKTLDIDSIVLTDLESQLASGETTMKMILSNQEALQAQFSSLNELRAVLERATHLFYNAPQAKATGYGSSVLEAAYLEEPMFVSEAPASSSGAPVSESLLRPGSAHFETSSLGLLLSYYTGIIATAQVPAFERILFRATRGNCFARFAEIHEPILDPETKQMMKKSVYLVFFSGVEAKNKISKICSAFGATKYPFSENEEERNNAYAECRRRIHDLDLILAQTKSTRIETLKSIQKNLPVWKDKVLREKAVFHSLNLLNYDTSGRLFIGEAWCPSDEVEDVRSALERGRIRARVSVDSILERKSHGHKTHPPTHFRTNRFTAVFQGIVESYGIASYKELNPAIFTVISFPFLFAVMFGDIGHGIIMTAVAAYVVSQEKKLAKSKLDEMMETVFDGRYIILLMGLFSIFTGFIYNEFFALPLDLFTSRWKYTAASTMACGIDNCMNPAQVLPPLSPYPFGFDPIWKSSQTALLFFNSYKMKLSVVLGVSQMVMGIVCSYSNAKYFKEPVDIWYVFVPQMIFMNATFGYLVFLIFLKWLTDWNAPGAAPAPDLKAILIGLFMSPGSVPPELQMYPFQAQVQLILFVLALVAVPWMLIPKPMILKARHEARMSKKYRLIDDKSEVSALLEPSGVLPGSSEQGKLAGEEYSAEEDEEEFDFSEVLVHQMIHTIEFVLGAVSNTASYLRLWALSLAHAELSDVFLEKLLIMTMDTGNPIAIAIGFVLWAGATIGVLMLMESLSAFLHALRLHWVEFQNKFYNMHGDGVKFEPFSYTSIGADA